MPAAPLSASLRAPTDPRWVEVATRGPRPLREEGGGAGPLDRPEAVAERLAALAEADAAIVRDLPLEPRIH